MKKILTNIIIAFAACATSAAQSYKAYDAGAWRGDNYKAADGSLVTFEVPEAYPHTSLTPTYNVSVDDAAYVGLYNDKNYWNGNVQFGYFDFKEGTTPTVTVAAKTKINSFEILPHDADVSDVSSSARYISFKVNKPGQKITLVVNGSYKGDVLHLFCNTLQPEPELSRFYNESTHYDNKTGTYYFGPGYWDLNNTATYGGKLNVSGNRKLYIAPGAVVRGQVSISSSMEGNQCARIYGHGVVLSDKDCGTNGLNVAWTNGGEVDGIIVFTHGHTTWQTTYTECKNVKVSDIKIIGTNYASTDGMDLTRCNDCTFDNIFVRSCDDAVAIKGLYDETMSPSQCPPNTNLTFSRMQLWNDCNNAFGIGAETRASEFSNIRLTDSYILFSYDDPMHHGRLDERSAMNICSLHGTYFSNITFENIYVNRCERLIGMGFKDSFWFGSLPGDQSTEGGISGVTFRNITCPNNVGSRIANNIRLYGWQKQGTPSKAVEDITFDNVTIEGNLLKSETDTHFDISEEDKTYNLVRNIKFLPDATGIDNMHDDKQATAGKTYYNLQGMKVEKPAKGIYIYNGRKIAIR